MSIFCIESAAQWLEALLVQEAQYLSEVSDKVEELQSELEWMQCFLLDADGKQNNNSLIRKWVSELSNLSLEAEDLIEMYVLEVSNERQDGFLNTLKSLPYFWRDAKTLHVIGSQIDRLTSKISKLSSRLQTYGVRSSYDIQSSHMAMTKKFLAEQRRTYAHAQIDFIVGLEPEGAKLIKKLQNDPEKILVVHGMGGIGKTALAKQVYRKCLSQGHFVSCAWAYVSQQCSIEAVCKDLLNELIPKYDEERSRINNLEASQLPGKIFDILKRKNCLIILDDVWTVRDWKCLEPAFPIHDTSCGSKILVTTRNPQIFSDLGEDLVSTWETQPLKEDSCWELLENNGCFKRNGLDSLMKKVAEKMLGHCNGHPLAIIALGGFLATKKSLEEWESVCKNIQSHLQGDEESYSGVYDVLAMSYYDLHYNLRPCFLHMGHFPEDSRIDVEKLYNLWIADGIVSSTQDQIGKERSLEDIADNYMNQLVQRGMIQVNRKDSDGRISSCSLHDLMRDYCLEMTREENFLQIMYIDEQQNASADARSDKARRVTMYVGKEDGQSVLKSLSGKFSSLRSLMFISTNTEQDEDEDSCEWIRTLCRRFKLLRVLDFEGRVVLKGTFPSEVGNLIYLKYLCLKGTRITELPSSIRKLKSLLLLDLRVSRVIIKLPNVLSEMISLCWLYFPVRILSQEYDNTQGYEIEDGSQLILNKLSHLERVSEVDLDKVDVKSLLERTSMRKLSATCRQKKESLIPFLKSSTIKHLSLKIDAGLLTGNSEMLLSKSSSLRILHIDAESWPPTQITIRVNMFPCNLVELGFWYCKLSEDPMPVLEKLPNLRNLQLHICYRGVEMNCSDTAFPELTYLELDGLFSLKFWNVEKGGFPKLLEMAIYNCPLQKISDALHPGINILCSSGLDSLANEYRLRDKASEEEQIPNLDMSSEEDQMPKLCEFPLLVLAIIPFVMFSFYFCWSKKHLSSLGVNFTWRVYFHTLIIAEVLLDNKERSNLVENGNILEIFGENRMVK
ncbi:hypothetical protein RND81_08G084400 [Saponaria officinalis]|uniref:Disease resistance protein n=1 Tax=Saponaria officinalis TaxID=3572 RepID=A0AAW1J5Y2_SAPOF